MNFLVFPLAVRSFTENKFSIFPQDFMPYSPADDRIFYLKNYDNAPL